jgi:hypothetical protein
MAKEVAWATRQRDWATLDPLAWEHLGRSLREWFHELCREASEPQLCAYCDGELYVTARATIDHFAPRTSFQALSVTWWNLFPACDICNETFKRDQWSCSLIRPDVDPVDEWFDVDLKTGILRPAPEVTDPIIRARVRLTIVVLGLNSSDRCNARRLVVRNLENARKRDAETMQRDHDTLEAMAAKGPYRFVARRYLDAFPVSTRTPAAP